MNKALYKLTFLLFTTLISLSFVAQDNFAERFQDANLSMDEKKYIQAAGILEELIKEQPENANLHYRLGICYSNIPLGDEKAIAHLEKAILNLTSNYNPIYHTEKNAPYETHFHLANVYLDYGKPKKAIEYYEKFLEEVNKKHVLRDDANHGIKSSNTAIEMMKNPIHTEVKNLGDRINSKYDEHSPVLSLDETTIYFTSQRLRKDSSNVNNIEPSTGHYFEDIYVSYKDDDGVWGEPELLPFSRKDAHDATSNISADGASLFIYRDELNGTLYESKLVDGSWITPVRLGSNINTKYFENHVSVSADNQFLFFSSDRKGGEGGIDIYFCKKLPNGKWGLAQNIGKTINSKYDDQSPNIHPDGKTLYFTSKGHKNMGGFDIMYSELQDDGSWSEPANIGYPVNTTHDEQVFFVTPDGKRGYYQSYGVGGYGEGDIYMVELKDAEETGLTLLKGKIVLPPGAEFPNKLRIMVTDVETGKFIAEARPQKRNGTFVFIIPPGKNYKLTYELDGNEFYNETTFVPLGSEYKEIQKEVALDPVKLEAEVQDSVIVNNAKKNPKWQLRYSTSNRNTTAETVQYLSAINGNVMYEEKVDKNGYFKYHQLEDQEYIFRLKNIIDAEICESGEIVLVDGPVELRSYKLLPDPNCIFTAYHPSVGYVRFLDKSNVSYDKLKVKYVDRSNNVLLAADVDKNGYFEYYPLPDFREYIIMLESSEDINCLEAIVVVSGADNKRVFLEPDVNAPCTFKRFEKPKFKYINNDTIPSGAVAQYLSEEGTILYEENIVDNRFKFNRLASSVPYRIKISLNDQTLCKGGELHYFRKDGSGYKLKPEEDCIYKMYDVIDPVKEKVIANVPKTDDKVEPESVQTTEEPKEKTEEEKIKDQFESTLVQNTTSNNKVFYKTNFGYNKNTINVNDVAFKKFIDDAVKLAEQKGEVKISIESGASKVPTKSFKSNEELARTRAYKAKDILLEELRKKGVKPGNVSFVNVTYLVQGPDYKKDAYNVNLYEPFQYVKLWSVNVD